MPDESPLNEERRRLEAQAQGTENWRLWGPYLAERAWGTVREDYSDDGEAWEYFGHDQSHLRAYRWNEDGMGGICDEKQNLCFALTLWNGRDPILKERAFGLSGKQGNHGEDVKEIYFYPDALPSHSYMKYIYKYPQREFPYQVLVNENKQRSRNDPAFNLLDTGIFDDNRYWDVEVTYAKASTDQIHVNIVVTNRGPETETLHLLPTLWFRNTWSWEKNTVVRPILQQLNSVQGSSWVVEALHPELPTYRLYGSQEAQLLFTENISNTELLWGESNETPYVKDAFNRHVIQGDESAVNPTLKGTKSAAWSVHNIDSGKQIRLNLVLAAEPMENPFADSDNIFIQRRSEADHFYEELLPGATPEDSRIVRQALGGMIWSKQFYHYNVAKWQEGDLIPPPKSRKDIRNEKWRHFEAADIISMPDTWEYPWFAAWDLAFHCATLGLVDVDFAKGQVELLLKENYLHPNGQIAAYEWHFDDVNPPVLAFAALKLFRAERVQRGKGDHDFLRRVFLKFLMNYTWWLNRKDAEGHNLFEGGFMGLDNISVYDRSRPLPSGYSLKQADATGWMAMFALNMTVIALELAQEEGGFEDIAIQCFTQFLAIAKTLSGDTAETMSLWDNVDGFFKDLLVEPDGTGHHIDVFSWVGLIPLFACEIIDERLLEKAPRFRSILESHSEGLFDGQKVCACPKHVNVRGEHLIALVDETMLPRILKRLLSHDEFLSPYGIRSVSAIHTNLKNLGSLPGIGEATIEYVPGESNSPAFGGNSNWRGPIWMPMNFMLVQAIEKFHRFLGDGFTIQLPSIGDRDFNLKEVAQLISERLVSIFYRNENGIIPAFPKDSPFQNDPNWDNLLLFNEYFHAETGQGLGASHQTGWTGLVANLVFRKYRKDIPKFWRDR